MATLGPTSGNNPPAWQISQYQARLQQARRNAAQAQDTVRQLEAETERARSDAARAEDGVRGLERQAPQGRGPSQPSVVNTQGQVTGRILNTLA